MCKLACSILFIIVCNSCSNDLAEKNIYTEPLIEIPKTEPKTEISPGIALRREPGSDLTEFSEFVRTDLIGKVQLTGVTETGECFTTYLGTIRLGKKRTLYHVLSQYYEVQAAIVKHGHSRIIALDKNKRTVDIYFIDSQEDLPIGIRNNQLKFLIDKQVHFVSLGDSLPYVFCLPENRGCY